MPRGAKVKTSWQKKQKGSTRRKGEAWRGPGDRLEPGRSVKVVMGKREGYEHPLEEIFDHPGHVHDRLVEIQKECDHSFTKSIAEKRSEYKVSHLLKCEKCWAVVWR